MVANSQLLQGIFFKLEAHEQLNKQELEVLKDAIATNSQLLQGIFFKLEAHEQLNKQELEVLKDAIQERQVTLMESNNPIQIRRDSNHAINVTGNQNNIINISKASKRDYVLALISSRLTAILILLLFIIPSKAMTDPPAPLLPPYPNGLLAIPIGGVLLIQPEPTFIHNKKTEFRIYVLSSDYVWKLGSSNTAIYLGQELSIESILAKEFSSPSLKNSLKNSRDIISIGTASCEGPPDEEMKRADERALRLRGIIKRLTPSGNPFQPYYTLSLGQFRNPRCSLNPSDTAGQRRIVIISVVSRETEELDPRALRKVLAITEISDFSLKHYPDFKLSL
jgi:hypothetical protein